MRGSKYINDENYNYSLIDVPNLFSNLLMFPYNLIRFCVSIVKSYKYLKLNNYNTLISTGGYMSLPLCLASNLLNIKTYIFEPNSVIGRANKLTLSFAKKVICYDKNLKGISKKFLSKVYPINPLLRKEIYKYERNRKTILQEKKKILIIGGSQGAKFFDEFISKMITKLSKTENICVLQQVIDYKSKENIRELYQKNQKNHQTALPYEVIPDFWKWLWKRFWKALDGSESLWMATESFGELSRACTQLAECQKWCFHKCWEACFVKSILRIAEV